MTHLATTYPAIVGNILMELRRAQKKTQGELSSNLDLGVSTWSRIENGESALTIEQLAMAADALGKTPSEILRLADEAVLLLKQDKGIGTVPNRDGLSEEAVSLSGSPLTDEITKAMDKSALITGLAAGAAGAAGVAGGVRAASWAAAAARAAPMALFPFPFGLVTAAAVATAFFLKEQELKKDAQEKKQE